MNRILKLDGDLLRKSINEIIKVTELQGTPWSRFNELNSVLKGFRTHELTVLSGHTGVGKTTFLCEYSLDLAENGVRTLWGSFEMPLRKICRTLIHQFAGEPLNSINPSRIINWANMFVEGVPMYFMNFHGSQVDNEIFKTMNLAVNEYGVEHILIDNLQFLLGTGGHTFNDRFHRQDLFVQELRSFATQYGAHITVVVHPRKEDFDRPLTISSLYGGAKVAQEADNIMLIQTEKHAVIPKKFLQIVKNRYDGTLGSLDLNFKKDRLCFRPRSRELIVPTESLAINPSRK